VKTAAGNPAFELIMREGVHPTRVVGKKVPPPPEYLEVRENGLHIERNVMVRMRDGVRIFVDIYRPDGAAGERDLPILLGWSPYGKHNLSSQLAWPAAEVAAGWLSPYTAFEAPDPMYWCGQGYAVVYPDPRGSWYSEGEQRHGGMGEAEDCFDLIEWLGERPWSNGKVGMSGVSYLTAIQWQVAPLRPPHLAAINPWEGFSDWYREFAYHGGIPETRFVVRGSGNLQWSTTRTEDTPANVRAHPLHDAYWASKECDLGAIQVPAYVVASWADQGLHTRGTLEAYKRIASSQKWLEVHGRKKWRYYYDPANVEKQRAFFDRFLKNANATLFSQPTVLIEVRERANVGEFRAESEWPLARTDFRRLYLNATDGALTDAPVPTAGDVRYDSESKDGRAVFDYTFQEDTELTGHMSLRLWVEAIGSDDMDLFVAVQKFDRDGHYVPFVFYAMLVNGPVALGWLRVSHRELDPVRSRPEQPFHPHTREQRLRPNERVPVAIEIWPSSTQFAAGERLRIVVQGRDVEHEALPNSPFAAHDDTRNKGSHVIHAGGRFDSYLLVPVIPAHTLPTAAALAQ
jgi:predicted acyl esterase